MRLNNFSMANASIFAILMMGVCSCNKEENMVTKASFSVNVTAGTESSNPVMNIQQISGNSDHTYKFKTTIDGLPVSNHDSDVPDWVFCAEYTNEKHFVLPNLSKGTHELALTFYSGDGKIDEDKVSQVVTTSFTVSDEVAPVFSFWNGNGFPSEPVFTDPKAFSKTTATVSEEGLNYEKVSLVSPLVSTNTIDLYPYDLRNGNFTVEFSDPSKFVYDVVDNAPGAYFNARKILTISAKGKTALFPEGEYTATITWGGYSETFVLVKNTKVENAK